MPSRNLPILNRYVICYMGDINSFGVCQDLVKRQLGSWDAAKTISSPQSISKSNSLFPLPNFPSVAFARAARLYFLYSFRPSRKTMGNSHAANFNAWSLVGSVYSVSRMVFHFAFQSLSRDAHLKLSEPTITLSIRFRTWQQNGK